MIKRIVQNIKTQKNGEIGEIFGRPHGREKKIALLELSLGRELKRIESLDVDSKEFVSKAKLYIPSTEKCYWKNSKNLEL